MLSKSGKPICIKIMKVFFLIQALSVCMLRYLCPWTHDEPWSQQKFISFKRREEERRRGGEEERRRGGEEEMRRGL
jgi:hypothetical protein